MYALFNTRSHERKFITNGVFHWCGSFCLQICSIFSQQILKSSVCFVVVRIKNQLWKMVCVKKCRHASMFQWKKHFLFSLMILPCSWVFTVPVAEANTHFPAPAPNRKYFMYTIVRMQTNDVCVNICESRQKVSYW